MKLPIVDHENRRIIFKGGGFKMVGLTGYCKVCKCFRELCRTAAGRWCWVRCAYCLAQWKPE